jgi:chromosome segregation ATPase
VSKSQAGEHEPEQEEYDRWARQLSEENAELRRRLRESERALLSSSSALQQEIRLRAEQSACLEEAWAKLTKVAVAEDDAKRDEAEARAWAAQCEQALGLVEAEAARTKAELASLGKKTTLHRSRAEAAQSTASTAQSKLAAADLELSALRREGQALRVELSVAAQQMEAARREEERMSKELGRATQQAMELQGALSRQHKDLEEERKKAEGLLSEGVEQAETIAVLRVQLGEEKKKAALVVSERVDLRETVAVLQGQVAELNAELSGHRSLFAFINKATADAASAAASVSAASVGAGGVAPLAAITNKENL